MRKKHHKITDRDDFAKKRIRQINARIISSAGRNYRGNIFQIFRVDLQVFQKAIRSTDRNVRFTIFDESTHFFVDGSDNPRIDLANIECLAK